MPKFYVVCPHYTSDPKLPPGTLVKVRVISKIDKTALIEVGKRAQTIPLHAIRPYVAARLEDED